MKDSIVKSDGHGVSAPVTVADRITLEAMINSIPDATVVIDELGRIERFSAAAEDMFGYREADVVGENVSILMPSPDRENHDSYLAHYHETGERRMIGSRRVTRARHRDGSNVSIELSVGEVRIGRSKFFVGFLHDLSVRVDYQKRLHALQSEMAHVARVTQMGTLATAIAHELNQPLAAITNYADAAASILDQRGIGPKDQVRQALELCSEEVQRASLLIQRLRGFLRSGDSDRRNYPIAPIIEESIALALADGEGHGVAVNVRKERGLPEVFVDRIQIQQVLVNLIRNALEAMSSMSTRSIAIRTRRAGPKMVEVTVDDSGPGIEPKIAGRLFQPFQSSKESGLGMGLSICHSIVDAHGGRIWVGPSRLGGTSFHFTLSCASNIQEPDP